MLELLHAVLTSLLLSAGVGIPADLASSEDEPAHPESGVDVGKLPAHLASLRGMAKVGLQGDDDLPAAIQDVVLCQPMAWIDGALPHATLSTQVVVFPTAGRSP